MNLWGLNLPIEPVLGASDRADSFAPLNLLSIFSADRGLFFLCAFERIDDLQHD